MSPARDLDPDAVAALEEALLDDRPCLTSQQAAEQAGVTPEFAAALRRAMGFPTIGPDEPAFGERDVTALRDAAGLIEGGWIGQAELIRLTRATGRAMSGLAAAQIVVAGAAASRQLGTELTALTPPDRVALAQAAVEQALPSVGRLQEQVWRRHLLDAALRSFGVIAVAGQQACVIVADLTGFSLRTRELALDELGQLVDVFEERAEGVVTDGGARVVKLLGDGVLATAADIGVAVQVAAGLVALPDGAPELPEVRVGLAAGSVLPWQGDVHGEPVVLASRLCARARPGTVLLDRKASDLVREELPEVRLKPVPPMRVRGYEHLLANKLVLPVVPSR